MWHRQNWSLLHPYVHLEEDELDDLRSGPAYIAGFVDAAVESNTDLYDLFVNLSTEEITVATHAKGLMLRSVIHPSNTYMDSQAYGSSVVLWLLLYTPLLHVHLHNVWSLFDDCLSHR